MKEKKKIIDIKSLNKIYTSVFTLKVILANNFSEVQPMKSWTIADATVFESAYLHAHRRYMLVRGRLRTPSLDHVFGLRRFMYMSDSLQMHLKT